MRPRRRRGGPDPQHRPSRSGRADDASDPASRGLLLDARITKRFGGLVAVRTIDFDIPEGSIVSLIGPNGAGKTTFFNIIAGLTEPTRGHDRRSPASRSSRGPPRLGRAVLLVRAPARARRLRRRAASRPASRSVGELLVLAAIALLIGSLLVAIIRPRWYVHLLHPRRASSAARGPTTSCASGSAGRSRTSACSRT